MHVRKTVSGKESRVRMIVYAAAFLITYLICVYLWVSRLPAISFSFQCQCLADCANLSKMAPAVRFPGKNSKRMECAANKVGLAPLCLNYSVSVNHSIPVYAGLNLPWLILHPLHTPASWIQDKTLEIVSHRFSIHPLPMAKFVFTFSSWGSSLISFKICSTWTQMTVNGSCGTLHTVCRAIGMACSPAVNARCLSFYNGLIKLPEGSNWRKPLILFPTKHLRSYASGRLKHDPFFNFYNIHL